jgi:hypothetical protein
LGLWGGRLKSSIQTLNVVDDDDDDGGGGGGGGCGGDKNNKNIMMKILMTIPHSLCRLFKPCSPKVKALRPTALCFLIMPVMSSVPTKKLICVEAL